MVNSKRTPGIEAWLQISGLLAVLGAASLEAQDRRMVGRVVDSVTAVGIAGAEVRAGAIAEMAMADSSGFFQLTAVEAGPVRLVVRAVGYRPFAGEVEVRPGDTIVVVLPRLPYRMSEITVTAEAASRTRRGEIGTASVVGRDAIEHVQASSLADVLQLVPGQLAQNPTLASARQSLLRQVPTDADAARANALGTALVLDGVPLSNNANLQTDLSILNSAPGALPPFSSVASRGFDLRSVPVDQIETLEVIRGVPSARHGELTTGALLVTSRAGKRRPEVRLRANPQAFEASFVAGWGSAVTGRRGISVDAGWLAALDDPRQDRARYGRLTLQGAWSERWDVTGRVTTTTRLTLFNDEDELRLDPLDPTSRSARLARDRGVRFTHTGRIRGGTNRFEWTLGLSAQQQIGRYQDLIVRDIFPLSTQTRDTTAVGVYGMSEYLNETEVDGQPVNLYGRVETGSRWRTGGWLHLPIAGIEWRWDRNFGAGRQFDPIRPPRQNYSVGDRPRRFDDVPGFGIVSAYLEDRLAGRVLGREVALQAGLRFDNIQPETPWRGRYGTVLAPRLNAQVDLGRGVAGRIGWGSTAKAPTLAQLFPGPKYFDLLSLNYFATNPAERMTVITTRVIKPSTDSLEPFTSRKAEIGLDFRVGRAALALIGFVERVRNALGYSRLPAGLTYPRYRIAEARPGQQPILDPVPIAVDTFVAAYDVARPTRAIDNSGLEVVLDLPEWRALRTSLQLGGAWTKTVAVDDAVTIDTDALFRGSVSPTRLGVYASGRGTDARQLVTSLRLVHRLPEAGLVASMLAQTLWLDDDRPLGYSEFPIAIVDRAGRTVALTPEQARSDEYGDLRRPAGENALNWERRPPLWLFNLRLTKTLPAGLSFSFFANNVLADRPLYPSRRSAPDQVVYQRRNAPLFFGVEVLSTFTAGSRALSSE